jgi:hypothetical protein
MQALASNERRGAPESRPTRQSALAGVDQALSRVALLLARKASVSSRRSSSLSLVVQGRRLRVPAHSLPLSEPLQALGGRRRCQSSVMTALPLARRCSAYASASRVWSTGTFVDERAEVAGVVEGGQLAQLPAVGLHEQKRLAHAELPRLLADLSAQQPHHDAHSDAQARWAQRVSSLGTRVSIRNQPVRPARQPQPPPAPGSNGERPASRTKHAWWLELSTPDVAASEAFYGYLFCWSYEESPDAASIRGPEGHIGSIRRAEGPRLGRPVCGSRMRRLRASAPKPPARLLSARRRMPRPAASCRSSIRRARRCRCWNRVDGSGIAGTARGLAAERSARSPRSGSPSGGIRLIAAVDGVPERRGAQAPAWARMR